MEDGVRHFYAKAMYSASARLVEILQENREMTRFAI
jgi:hypothetical protein